MRINVNGGHTRRAPGASGHLDELAEDRLVKDALIAELRSRGHEVIDSTTDEATQMDDLREQCRLANASGAELAISVHLNSGGGTGPECWAWTGNAETAELSQRVADSVAAALGLPSRGAKSNQGFYWLRHTDMPAILVECCFVDSERDAEAWRRVGPQAVARAIADAIVGEAAPSPEPAPEPAPAPEAPRRLSIEPGTYRCTVDHLRVRTGPGLGYPEVAHYDEGETVELDAWCVEADGWVWGTYEDYGGTRRYIAVGPYTGEPDPERDYLVLA